MPHREDFITRASVPEAPSTCGTMNCPASDDLEPHVKLAITEIVEAALSKRFPEEVPRPRSLQPSPLPPKVVRFHPFPLQATTPSSYVVDQRWGQLFDAGSPTLRLEEVLRGVANYIVSILHSYCHY